MPAVAVISGANGIGGALGTRRLVLVCESVSNVLRELAVQRAHAQVELQARRTCPVSSSSAP